MSTFVIIASGPSLTIEQCEAVRLWRACALGKVITINRSYRRAPWADYLYACDETYIRYDIDDIRRVFKGEVWTQDVKAAKDFGLKHIVVDRAAGLSRKPGVLHHGGYTRSGGKGSGNGGYQAVNLAYQWGAKKIVLLGFDMQERDGRTHWHEPHVLNVHSPYAWWVRCFEDLGNDLARDGVEVLNATPDSALPWFRQVTLAEALDAVPMPAA